MDVFLPCMRANGGGTGQVQSGVHRHCQSAALPHFNGLSAEGPTSSLWPHTLCCTDRITLWKLHICPDISHSQPVLTLREHTVTWGNHCCRRIPGAEGYFFVMENTDMLQREKTQWLIPVFCFWFFLQCSHSLFPHTSSLCSVFDRSQYGQNKLELLIIACPDPLFQIA